MNKQDALENTRREIENLQAGALELARLPDPGDVYALDVSAATYANDTRIYVTFPFDLARYRDYRRDLTGVGWKIKSAFLTNSGQRHACFEREDTDVRLVVVLNPNLNGSTCVCERVGEVTEPVYRVKCGGDA